MSQPMRIKVGLTISSSELDSFSRSVLSNASQKLSALVVELEEYSNDPITLFAIASQISTLSMQIEDMAVAKEEYQEYMKQQENTNQQEE
jgi:hypothetical protein